MNTIMNMFIFDIQEYSWCMNIYALSPTQSPAYSAHWLYEKYPDSKVYGGQHGAHLGPTGPRWVPCWPHESCYLGTSVFSSMLTPRTNCHLRNIRWPTSILSGVNKPRVNRIWQNTECRIYQEYRKLWSGRECSISYITNIATILLV